MILFNLKFTKFKCLFIFTSILFVSTLTFIPVWPQILPTLAAERMNGLLKKKLLLKDSLLRRAVQEHWSFCNERSVVDIEVNPKDPIEFYVAYATDGLWHTKNNGQSLVPVFDYENVIGNGPPSVPVHDIAIQKTANEIVIGTHGRGI